jgi:hypothetical protein
MLLSVPSIAQSVQPKPQPPTVTIVKPLGPAPIVINHFEATQVQRKSSVPAVDRLNEQRQRERNIARFRSLIETGHDALPK